MKLDKETIDKQVKALKNNQKFFSKNSIFWRHKKHFYIENLFEKPFLTTKNSQIAFWAGKG